MALCRRERLSIVRGEVGSGPAPSGKASRVSEYERGGVEKNGVAFAMANASRFFERSRYRKNMKTKYYRCGTMALCRRERLSIVRGEVGSAGNEVSSLPLSPKHEN